jgi:hypothetical protein
LITWRRNVSVGVSLAGPEGSVARWRLPLLQPHSATLADYVRAAGWRWKVEESFQTGKELVGPDEQQVNTRDHERREKLLDAILTIPPLTEWPADCREKLWETCQFVISCARELRRRTETRNDRDD